MSPESNFPDNKKPCESNNMASEEKRPHVQPGFNGINAVQQGVETVRTSSNSISEKLDQLANTHTATGSLLDVLANALENAKNTIKTSEYSKNLMEQLLMNQVVDLKFQPLKDVLSILVGHHNNFRKHLESMHVIQIVNQKELETLARKSSAERVNPGLAAQVFQAQLQYVSHVNSVFKEVARLANEASIKKHAEMMEAIKDNCFEGDDGEIYAIQKVDPRLLEALEARYGEILVDETPDSQITVSHPVDPVQINFADFQTNTLLGNLLGNSPVYVKQDFTPKMLSKRSKGNLANLATPRPVSIRNRAAAPSQQVAEPQVEQNDALPSP